MATTKSRLAAMGVAGLLTAGSLLSVLNPAIAQDGNQTPSDASPFGEQREQREQRRAEHEAEFAAALADELDLPTEQVAEAIETVRERMREEHKAERLAHLKQRLDAAVADGTLTQEQADAIYAAAEAGTFPLHPRGQRGPGQRGPGHRGPGPRGPGGAGQAGADQQPANA